MKTSVELIFCSLFLWIGQKSEEKKKESSLADGEEIATEDSTEYIKPQTVSRNSSSDTGTLNFTWLCLLADIVQSKMTTSTYQESLFFFSL